jgi:hypothetical protein
MQLHGLKNCAGLTISRPNAHILKLMATLYKEQTQKSSTVITRICTRSRTTKY